MKVRVGTSGWHYRHWIGPFYPPGLPARKMLQWYSERFDTVEINNSFYRLPTENALQTWHETVRAQFRFAMKGSRFLTHMKKLKDPKPGLKKFFARADRMGRKLGPVVFQLPPNWPVNAERLEGFLEALPSGHRYSFEFRHVSWHTEEVYRLLRKYRTAFCIFDMAGFTTPMPITTDFTYVRFHGPDARYQGRYDMRALKTWAERIRSWGVKTAYVYFNNDIGGHAVENAFELRRLLEQYSGTVSGITAR